MTDSTYFMKSAPLRAFIGSFQHFAEMLQTYWRYVCGSLMLKKYFLTNWQGFELSHFLTSLQQDVCIMTNSTYFVKSTPLRAFIGSFQHFAEMLQTYWRYVCGSLMLKKYFLTNWQGFELSHFLTTLQQDVCIMTNSTYFVKSTPLRAFIGSFQHFAEMLQTYWRCACGSLMLKKYFLTNWHGFELSHFPTTAPST